MTPEQALEFTPHSRTSCSDDNPHNGYPNEKGMARCQRCALLRIQKEGLVDEVDYYLLVRPTIIFKPQELQVTTTYTRDQIELRDGTWRPKQ